MLSRPNIVMNHGSPAAGRLLPPITGGAKRSAARSTRLRRYVVVNGSQSDSTRGASSSHLSRLRSMFGRALVPLRSYFGVVYVPPTPAAVTTSRSVVQAPCGSLLARSLGPVSSKVAGADYEIYVSRRYVSCE